MIRLSQFVLKYKLLHFVFWGYAFFSQWHMIAQIRMSQSYVILNFVDCLFNVALTAMCAYMCLGWLFSSYFIRKRYLTFFLGTLALVIFFSILGIVIQLTYVPMFLPDVTPSNSVELLVAFTAHFTDTFIYTLLLLIVHTAYYYFNLENKNQKTAHLKLLAELNQLKSQLSPEFMLDALNGIDMELKLNPDHASELLQHFSSLMRYTLQNSNVDMIELTDEIDVIKNYLAVRKLIHQDTIMVTSIFETQASDHQIPPYLILPLVDQAFKWCSSSPSQENQVTISLFSDEVQLVLDITHTVTKESHLLLPIQMEALNQIKMRFEGYFPNKFLFELHSTTSFHAFMVKLRW
jgi:two-component system, LytTR family, sensor kinase